MNRREFLSATAATMAAGTLMPQVFSAPTPQKSDGMNYAPQGKPNPVVKAGEFNVAAIRLDHGHIYGMCNG
ncbi:MAG TPA: twin-arginine translocation signal domain-containing protein, partial [Opitutaceae bacterium]